MAVDDGGGRFKISTIILWLSEPLASLFVSIQAADVEPSGTHGPSMHGGFFYHVVGEVAGCIFATSIFYAVTNEVEVFFPIYIKRWNGPMALRLLGLLFHIEDAVMLVHDDDTGALEFLNARLLVAHDTTGTFLLGKIDKLLEGEEEQVVGCNNQHIIVDVQLLYYIE